MSRGYPEGISQVYQEGILNRYVEKIYPENTLSPDVNCAGNCVGRGLRMALTGGTGMDGL